MTTWQPMDTAPLDGSPVDLLLKWPAILDEFPFLDERFSRWVDCRYEPKEKLWVNMQGWSPNMYYKSKPEPVGWMPIPELTPP